MVALWSLLSAVFLGFLLSIPVNVQQLKNERIISGDFAIHDLTCFTINLTSIFDLIQTKSLISHSSEKDSSVEAAWKISFSKLSHWCNVQFTTSGTKKPNFFWTFRP